MEEQIKNTVSKYTKIPAEQIAASTVIDRSTVASSIILHRMYAQLANEGIVVNDYTTIKTFGQLMANVNGKEVSNFTTDTAQPISYSATEHTQAPSIGIDIENITAMAPANDFREDNFYKMNFSPAEIAYCILQPKPYASFAGLFAAKEAIIKADNSYKSKTFNLIAIDHLPDGKPVFPGFQISISHTAEMAIAVAVKNISLTQAISANPQTAGNPTLTNFLSLSAFLISLLTLVLFLFKSC